MALEGFLYIYIYLEYRIDFKELMKKFGRERD